MAQEWTEEKLLKEDPLHDVTDEIQHSTPHLKHVDLHEKAPEDVQMQSVVKSEVPDAFFEELKNDHFVTEGVHSVGGTEEGFMEADPLHDIKAEIESGSPHLRHVETPDSPMAAPQSGDVVKSEVPEAFEEELKNDHDIVKGTGVPAHESNEFKVRGLSARGTPTFRISAHHGMRPGGPLSRDLKSEVGNVEEGADPGASTEAKPEDTSTSIKEDSIATKQFTSRGIPSQGTSAFRISAHHGMRPGGTLSRDLKSESTESSGRGGLSNSAPRRGGLARTGSGVPGDQRGGSSLARTGSGVPGNSLARTGSGVPSSKGGNDLKDFSSFLDAADITKE